MFRMNFSFLFHELVILPCTRPLRRRLPSQRDATACFSSSLEFSPAAWPVSKISSVIFVGLGRSLCTGIFTSKVDGVS